MIMPIVIYNRHILQIEVFRGRFKIFEYYYVSLDLESVRKHIIADAKTALKILGMKSI